MLISWKQMKGVRKFYTHWESVTYGDKYITYKVAALVIEWGE